MLYISVMAVLASCGDGEAARGVLRRADSLMEEHTDSAMALLRRDSVMLVHAPKPQRMAYILSKQKPRTNSTLPTVQTRPCSLP